MQAHRGGIETVSEIRMEEILHDIHLKKSDWGTEFGNQLCQTTINLVISSDLLSYIQSQSFSVFSFKILNRAQMFFLENRACKTDVVDSLMRALV